MSNDFLEGLTSSLLNSAFKDDAEKVNRARVAEALRGQKELFRFQDDIRDQNIADQRRFDANTLGEKRTFEAGLLKAANERADAIREEKKRKAVKIAKIKNKSKVNPNKTARNLALQERWKSVLKQRQDEINSDNPRWFYLNQANKELQSISDEFAKQGIDVGDIENFAGENPKDIIRKNMMKAFFPDQQPTTVTPDSTGTTGLKVGTIDSGYKYLGGDPSDKSNWEKQ